jgi:predicted PurR-regulated permease PerM
MSYPDVELERRVASRLMDVLIRAGLILALVLLCYRIFSPFLTLMVWALILAVTLYPLHQMLAAKMGGKQGWSATVLTLLGVALIVAPTAVLMSSIGDSVQQLITDVQNNTLEIPPPRDRVAEWPLVGDKVHALWSKAHADLPALIQSMQPQIGDIAKSALAFVASIGIGLLAFVASFIIAGIIMAFGHAGSGASLAIFSRIVGPERGAEFTKLSTATIRAVAAGVLGVALIRRHGRQRAQAADARARRRCTDAGDPDRRTGRHGCLGHSWHVRRRDAAGPRLPDLHGLGTHQPGRRSG